MCIEDAFECIDDERVLFFGFAEPWLWPSCVIERGINLRFVIVLSLDTSGSRKIQSREATASQACVVIPGREGRQESWAGRQDAIELDLQPSTGDNEMAVT